MLNLQKPEPLAAVHRTDAFACGEPVLDDWLKRCAMANQLSGASRTFVVTDEDHRVFGYYALAAGAVARQMASGSIRRNMPDPIPILVLGRLAVDQRAQGMRLGSALLQDALNRSVTVSQQVGVRALLVHALHERARQFYEHYGFVSSPVHRLTLMMRLPAG